MTPRGPVPVRRLGASFNAMAERLDRSRDDRRALLADVTHELRTPLTVISGGLEAMLDGVHPMDEDHISPILAEAAVMDRLLDDLRTISLAEAGALPLHREPVDLVELAADVLPRSGRSPTPAGSRWCSAGDATVEADVDPVRVREILVNLVANAIRHTPAPRPDRAVATAASASRSARSSPGRQDQTARGDSPASRASRSAAPPSYGAQRVRSAGGGPGGFGLGFLSVVAWRGGTASRSTSERVPAQRAAISPVRAAISAVSTGSGLTTRRSGISRPGWADSAARARTNPSTS